MTAKQGTHRCNEHGLFLEPHAVASKSQAQRILTAQAGSPSFPCPACGQTMTLMHPKKMDIEVCGCGAMWLDQGEEKILTDRYGQFWWLIDANVELLGWLFGAV
jgi:predicted RNA-binding Zn-ribbon protein involved in translation (DUF1610 family)